VSKSSVTESSATGSNVPLVDVPPEVSQRLAELGAPDQADRSKLYRALAGKPDLLLGWVDLAWRLRGDLRTPVRLRELMILRGVQLADNEFEIVGHQIRARAAGVTDEELAEVETWRSSQAFSEAERAALQLAEDLYDGSVAEETQTRLAQVFSDEERIELVLTASFFCMVTRVMAGLELRRD
jgi:4-carboxymuconolactone decarboxylase